VTGDETDGGSVLELMDQLEELVTGARRVPLSASIVVNEDDALELIDRARLRLPDELVQARHTMEDRERILGEARHDADQAIARGEEQAQQAMARASDEAQRLVREAGERAVELVGEHAITLQARAHAASLVSDAETQAASVRAEVDAYAREVMVKLEEQLARAASTVRKGIDALPRSAPVRRRRPSPE